MADGEASRRGLAAHSRGFRKAHFCYHRREVTVTEFLQKSVPFLAGITADHAHFLAASAEQLVFHKGQTVIFRGVTVDGLHVIASGKVTVHAKVGRDTVQVAELGPGQVFGETSIIEMSVAGATIKAAEDETLIFVLPEESFKKIMAMDPDFQARVMALIAERKKVNADKQQASDQAKATERQQEREKK